MKTNVVSRSLVWTLYGLVILMLATATANTSARAATRVLDYPYPSDGACGGVIEGNNRTLVWESPPPPTPALCVWAIQPVGRQHVIFQVLDWALDPDDELTVTVGTSRTIVVNTTAPYEYSSFISFALIVLRLRGSGSGKYLHMSIQGRPPPWVPSYPNLPVYNWHSEAHVGEMRYPKGNPDSEFYLKDEIATFVVANPQTALEGYDILLEIDELDVEWHHSGFNFAWTNCDMDSVDVYEILPELETICSVRCNPWETVRLLRPRDFGVCGEDGGYGYYVKAGFLLVFREAGRELRRGFHFNWKTIQMLPPPPDPVPVVEPIPGAYTRCGGVLEQDSGYIEYKLNEPLAPHELCVWTIRAPENLRISFTKEESGLIVGRDRITITNHRIPYDGYAGNWVRDVGQMNVHYGGREIFNLFGKLAVVIFTSGAQDEAAQRGTGFRLHFSAHMNGVDSFPRVYTDVGQYGDTGFVSHGGGKTMYFSSFVIAPNTTESFDHVQLTVEHFGVWAGASCSLNSLFLYEIVQQSSNYNMTGQLQLSERLCQTIPPGTSYTASRGFFGLLITTVRYTEPIDGYTFNYTIVN